MTKDIGLYTLNSEFYMLCELYFKLFKKGMPYKWNLQEKKTKVNVKYEEI